MVPSEAKFPYLSSSNLSVSTQAYRFSSGEIDIDVNLVSGTVRPSHYSD